MTQIITNQHWSATSHYQNQWRFILLAHICDTLPQLVNSQITKMYSVYIMFMTSYGNKYNGYISMGMIGEMHIVLCTSLNKMQWTNHGCFQCQLLKFSSIQTNEAFFRRSLYNQYIYVFRNKLHICKTVIARCPFNLFREVTKRAENIWYTQYWYGKVSLKRLKCASISNDWDKSALSDIYE